MRSKILSLAIAALMPLIAGSQTKTYTVRQGDTLSEIATQFGVRQAELVAVNGLSTAKPLRQGATLRIPARTPNAKAPAAAATPATKQTGGYVVRNGDSDWSIARRNGMTVKRLKELNPGVNFVNLKIGSRLTLETKSAPVVAAKPAAPATKPAAKPVTASTKPAVKPTSKPGEVPTRIYVVKPGDNDWTLARKIDTRVAVIQQLNPGVNTKNLKPGMKLRIPGVYGANADGSLSGKLVAQNAKPAAKPGVAPSKSPALKSRYAAVNVDAGIIRRGGKSTAEKVAVVDKGTRVVVLDRQGDWYKLKFPKGTVGWMRGDLLKPVSAGIVAREEAAKTVASKPTTKTVASAKTASKPSTKATTRPSVVEASVKPRPVASKSSSTKRLTSSRPGKPVVVASRDSGGGRPDVIDTAKDQLGVRYRWGGTSRGGFDCSGFVQYVYKKNGVSLPRTSREMASAGQSVSRGNLKEGDLITFATRGSGRGVSHVGMYIGNGKFIHASSGKGQVRVDSLSSSYYSKRIVNMRRVAPSKAPSAPAKKETREIAAPDVDKTN